MLWLASVAICSLCLCLAVERTLFLLRTHLEETEARPFILLDLDHRSKSHNNKRRINVDRFPKP